jgi:cytochrome P450
MRNPKAYKTLTAEIDAAVDAGTLSIPATFADAIKLPYLKACINESMRLHPSVGLTMPRVVPAGGATISGFHFSAGYRVGINAAVVQYDRDVFGPDAEEFNPDRWITGDSVRMDSAMIHFGGGTRTCIGKNVSVKLLCRHLCAH